MSEVDDRIAEFMNRTQRKAEPQAQQPDSPATVGTVNQDIPDSASSPGAMEALSTAVVSTLKDVAAGYNRGRVMVTGNARENREDAARFPEMFPPAATTTAGAVVDAATRAATIATPAVWIGGRVVRALNRNSYEYKSAMERVNAAWMREPNPSMPRWQWLDLHSQEFEKNGIP